MWRTRQIHSVLTVNNVTFPAPWRYISQVRTLWRRFSSLITIWYISKVSNELQPNPRYDCWWLCLHWKERRRKVLKHSNKEVKGVLSGCRKLERLSFFVARGGPKNCPHTSRESDSKLLLAWSWLELLVRAAHFLMVLSAEQLLKVVQWPFLAHQRILGLYSIPFQAVSVAFGGKDHACHEKRKNWRETSPFWNDIYYCDNENVRHVHPFNFNGLNMVLLRQSREHLFHTTRSLMLACRLTWNFTTS